MTDNPHKKPMTDGSEFVLVNAMVGENVYLIQDSGDGKPEQITLSHAEAAQLCVRLYGLLNPEKIPSLGGVQ